MLGKKLPVRLVSVLIFATFVSCSEGSQDPIDREALVRRHVVRLSQVDTLASLSVGNGEFAFTVDASGLQSYYEEYERGVPLGTQSQWGWHRFTAIENYSLQDVAVYDTSCNGSVIPIAVQHDTGRKAKATHNLRTNPHRLHLGIVGLKLLDAAGKVMGLEELKDLDQHLDPWTGRIESNYQVEGVPVKVVLYGHQTYDAIAARVTSPLIRSGRLKVFMKFPYGSDCHVCPGYDWGVPENHTTQMLKQGSDHALLERTLDSTRYYVRADWTGAGKISEVQRHEWVLEPGESDVFEFSVHFGKKTPQNHISYESTKNNSESGWASFWKEGGVIDFSKATDPRANELERRIILSQYLTKIQCAGSLPPQETGLTMNSWYGKFHIEMHWWHGVHFALWDRLPLLEKSMGWYDRVQEKATNMANWQGFEGIRWQKMTDPYGDESPSSVGTYLIWQQPHLIYFAELIYRQRRDRTTLDQYKDLVFQTADFMADFASYDSTDGRYHLCAPLKPAQELFPSDETLDPPFELAYWHYGLKVAQEWRKRLGLKPDEKWQHVIDQLAPLAIKDELYLPSAAHPLSYEDDFYRRDHPVVLGALGMLPESERMDTSLMQNTWKEIWGRWQWETTWGWDYPMIAMTAARLGKPEQAIEALFKETKKNTYLPNGHNYQDERLRIYLPGNGGLLSAVAMMAAGWDGEKRNAPGFPKDGNWDIRWEGLRKMP